MTDQGKLDHTNSTTFTEKIFTGKKSVPFEFVPVASALHDDRTWKGLFTQYEKSLVQKGFDLNPTEKQGSVRVFWAATGGTERLMLEELKKNPQPAIIVAHPSLNSLPSALETLARVHQDGSHGRIIYMNGPGDEVGLQQLKQALKLVSTRQALSRARIGVIGEPSEWLVASCPDPEHVKSKWGPSVIPLHLEDALNQIQHDKESHNSEVKIILDAATNVREAKESDVQYASRVKPALHQIINKFQLTACTVRCFDLVKLLGTSGCLALSDLNDLGIISGCEGDVVSTVAMLWVHELLNTASWMANPSRINLTDNTLLLAHCTIPKTLTNSYQLRSHFESGLGVAIEGDVAMNTATLIRIGGKKMDKLWVCEADVVPENVRFFCCAYPCC